MGTGNEVRVGTVVKYREVLEEGDERYRGRVVELNGDRGVMRDLATEHWPVPPTRLFRLAEVEPASVPASG